MNIFNYYNSFFLFTFQSILIITKAKINFNLLKIHGNALSSVILFRGLIELLI